MTILCKPALLKNISYQISNLFVQQRTRIQGAFCVKLTPKIRDCTPTFIINFIMIFETPSRRYPNFCARNAPWTSIITINLSGMGNGISDISQTRYSSTSTDRNKAHYLKIKAGLLRYLDDFKTSFLLCR